MRILVVVAHPDDEVLTCGGSIHHERWSKGNDVHVVILSSRGEELNTSAHAACRILLAEVSTPSLSVPLLGLEDQRFDDWNILDITKRVRAYIEAYEPAEVWTHSSSDMNRDHRIVHEAVLTATRPVPGTFNPRRVLSFECPSSTEYGPEQMGFVAGGHKEISEDDLDAKHAALACYPSETRAAPHPRSPEAIRALATWRGACVGVRFAEAFRIERCIE